MGGGHRVLGGRIVAGLVALALAQAVLAAPGRPARAAVDIPDVELPRGHAEIAARIAEEGRARVIVGLRTSFVPEGALGEVGQESQRDRIARVAEGLARELEEAGVGPVQRFETLPVVVVEVDEDGLSLLLRSPRVASVEPEAEFELGVDESVATIGADVLHAAGVEGSGHAVAVLDTGVDVDHVLLAGRVVAEACFSSDTDGRVSTCPNGEPVQIGAGAAAPCAPLSTCFHGTHVAGIAVGAHATYGGVAPAADLVAVQVFHLSPCESGLCVRAALSDLVAALDHVAALVDELADETRIAAVNMSLGGERFSTTCDAQFPAMAAAVATLDSKGVAVVVSSGNDGAVGELSAPACLSGTIAVGASTRADGVASFSNGHPTLVELLAPGESIASAYPDDRLIRASGTSAAAPHVSGALALLRSLRPEDDVDALVAALVAEGVPVTDDRGGVSFTTSRLALAAFEPDPTPPDPDPLDPQPPDVPDGSTDPVDPSPSGLLRVTTEPAVVSAISVDGVHRADWGLDWLRLPVGAYEVCFGDVPGFRTPGCSTVDVVDGSTTEVRGDFERLGLLKVDVEPSGLAATVHVDGEWRDEYGLFAYMAPGTYEVCWGDVPGHSAPACVDAVVEGGSTTTVVGTYEVAAEPAIGPAPAPDGHGFLRATSSPAVVTSISVGGVVRGDWGLNWVKVPAGVHEVCFSGVPGFAAPACREVEVVPGVTSGTVGEFTPLGLLRVDVVPSVAVDVLIDDVPRNQFGLYSFFRPGTYEVCGTEAPDGRTAPCVTAVVTAGEETVVTLDYG